MVAFKLPATPEGRLGSRIPPDALPDFPDAAEHKAKRTAGTTMTE
jgi:hypothetical protein